MLYLDAIAASHVRDLFEQNVEARPQDTQARLLLLGIARGQQKILSAE